MTETNETIFTKIIKREIPSEIIYEDDTAIAFLTLVPITTGHTLVVPKKQVDKLWDLDDATYHHLFDIAKLIQAKIEKAYDYKRVGLLVEGFGVPHAHVHVFGYAQPLEPTMQYHIAHKRTLGPAELKTVADNLRAA